MTHDAPQRWQADQQTKKRPDGGNGKIVGRHVGGDTGFLLRHGLHAVELGLEIFAGSDPSIDSVGVVGLGHAEALLSLAFSTCV